MKKVSLFYDHIGPLYQLIYPNYSYIEKYIAKSLIERKIISDKISLIDMGCGSGYLLEEMRRLHPSIELYGCDISEQSIQIAKRNSRLSRSKIQYYNEDWLRFPENKKFDVLLCLGNSLTHFPLLIQKKIIMKFFRLINKNGIIIIDSYKNWKKYFEKPFNFEPKGIVKDKNLVTTSFIVTENNKSYIQRHVIFCEHHLTVNNNFNNKPKQSQYAINQYPFLLSKQFKDKKFSFSNLKLKDKLNLYTYYKIESKS